MPRPSKSSTAWSKTFPTPDLKERAASRTTVSCSSSRRKNARSEIDVSRKAQQYHRAAKLVKSFNEKGIPTQLLVEVREIERRDQQQRTADLAMAADLRKLADQLPSATQVLERARGGGLEGTRGAPERSATGWPPGAKPGRKRRRSRKRNSPWRCRASSRGTSWPCRSSRRPRCSGRPRTRPRLSDRPASSACAERLAQLDELDWRPPTASADMARRLEVLTRIIQLMPPPLHDGQPEPRRPSYIGCRSKKTTRRPSMPCGCHLNIIRSGAIRRSSFSIRVTGRTRHSTSGRPRRLAGDIS